MIVSLAVKFKVTISPGIAFEGFGLFEEIETLLKFGALVSIKTKVAVSVIEAAFSIPEIVTVSATIFVIDAEYVPSPLSLTVLITALPVEDSVTVPPLAIRG